MHRVQRLPPATLLPSLTTSLCHCPRLPHDRLVLVAMANKRRAGVGAGGTAAAAAGAPSAVATDGARLAGSLVDTAEEQIEQLEKRLGYAAAAERGALLP